MSFPSFISQNPGEIPIFGTFLAKFSFLAYFSQKIGYFEVLVMFCHTNVCLFWYEWKEETHRFTMVPIRRICEFSLQFHRGYPPPLVNRVIERGLVRPGLKAAKKLEKFDAERIYISVFILFTGTYFLCMIAMVCVSVLSTGVVMHMSSISQPMPRWVEHVFLDIIPRFLFLSVQSRAIEGVKVSKSSNQDDNDEANTKTDKEIQDCSDLVKYHELNSFLKFIKADMDTKRKEDEDHMQWKLLSKVVDRILLYLFTLFTVLCTLIISIQIITGSEMEYDEILRELGNYWILFKNSCIIIPALKGLKYLICR